MSKFYTFQKLHIPDKTYLLLLSNCLHLPIKTFARVKKRSLAKMRVNKRRAGVAYRGRFLGAPFYVLFSLCNDLCQERFFFLNGHAFRYIFRITGLKW